MVQTVRPFDTALGDIGSFQLPSGITGKGIPQVAAIVNLTATTDPGVGNDNTQGYGVGSMWFNAAAGMKRMWECVDATTGAAKWVFSGADYVSGGTNPVTEVTQFGLGAALMAEEGNINRQISSAGINPGSTGNDNVLAAFTLPANSFDALGRGLAITAQGSIQGTGTNAKRVKIIFNATTATVGSAVSGGTTVADTGTINTAPGSGGWSLGANIFKFGAANSNTQIALHQAAQAGNIVGTLVAPVTNLVAVENAPIIIAVTGNATTTATDITFNFLEVNAMN